MSNFLRNTDKLQNILRMLYQRPACLPCVRRCTERRTQYRKHGFAQQYQIQRYSTGRPSQYEQARLAGGKYNTKFKHAGGQNCPEHRVKHRCRRAAAGKMPSQGTQYIIQ